MVPAVELEMSLKADWSGWSVEWSWSRSLRFSHCINGHLQASVQVLWFLTHAHRLVLHPVLHAHPPKMLDPDRFLGLGPSASCSGVSFSVNVSPNFRFNCVVPSAPEWCKPVSRIFLMRFKSGVWYQSGSESSSSNSSSSSSSSASAIRSLTSYLKNEKIKLVKKQW